MRDVGVAGLISAFTLGEPSKWAIAEGVNSASAPSERTGRTLAAAGLLATLRAETAPTLEREELCALLRQVTPFALPSVAQRRRRGEARGTRIDHAAL